MKTTLIFLAIAVAVAPALSQNIVTNGSFESETNLLNSVPGTLYGVLGTDPAPDGWTFTQSDLTSNSYSESNADSTRPYDPSTSNYVNSQDGNWYLSLGAFNIGGGGPVMQADYDSLSQVLSTISGTTYNLTYYVYALGGDGTAGDGSGDYFNVTWNGNVVNGSQISDNATSTGGWVKYNFTVVGTGSDMLALNGYNDTTYVNVDNVSVVAQAVPEPASMAALGIGLIGLVARKRRK